MHRVRNGIIAGVVLLLGAGAVAHAQTSGYGSKYGSGDNTSAYTSSASKASAKSHAAAGTKRITATEVNDQYVFSPKGATVKVGTKVTWVNTSDAEHTVTSDAKAWKFDKELGTGKHLSFVFTKAGTYAYHCKYHPGMVGTITVKR